MTLGGMTTGEAGAARQEAARKLRLAGLQPEEEPGGPRKKPCLLTIGAGVCALAYTIAYRPCARRPSDAPHSQKARGTGCAQGPGDTYTTPLPLLGVRYTCARGCRGTA